jgi:hypothetical protein
MTISELIKNNSNLELFCEFIHDLNKIDYIFESNKLTYSDIELIRKIQDKYINALISKNKLKYFYNSKFIKYQ